MPMLNWYDLHEEWFAKIPSDHDRFAGLMRLALHALKTEDEDLSRRFALGTVREFASTYHPQYNQGVGTLAESLESC